MRDDKTDRQDEDIEFMDLDQENESEEPEDWNDDWQDEAEPIQPFKMTLVFAGLAVLAAIICGVLWFFIHRGGDNTPDSDDTSTMPPVVLTEGSDAETVPEDQMADGQMSESVDGEGQDASPDAQPEVQQPSAPGELPDGSGDSTPAQDEKNEQSTPQEPEDGDTSMRFNVVQEAVTPKDVVNLRSVPSTADADTVVTQAKNGELFVRTGINPDTGWSEIDYNGQKLYAVTRYLTTDLSYKTPVTPADPNRVNTISGRIIIFSDCDDQLTPKEYVNLRTEPSTTEGDATVSCQVRNGEAVHRTGVSSDSGWSRVEYNGQVLYVVTSLMQAVQ